MVRFLLIGSSHAVRVERALRAEMERTDHEDNALLVLGKGGLRAEDTVSFITSRTSQIRAFRPTHVAVHVGHCDLVPKDLAKMGQPLTVLMRRFGEIKETMLGIVPTAKFAISEMFPRVLGHTEALKNHDIKMRAYNNKSAQAAVAEYNGIAPVIYHPRFRLSRRAAEPSLFLGYEGRFYGVHLNQLGNRYFAEDLTCFAFLR